MQIGKRVDLWVLGAALLAGGEFSYAHLRPMGLWPWELVSSSIARLAAACFEVSGFQGPARWAPLGIGAAWLAAAVLAWSRRRATAAREEENHNG